VEETTVDEPHGFRFVTPQTPLQITFSAAASTPTNSTTIAFTGTSGALTHTAQLSVSNTSLVASNPPPLRMRYVRTSAVSAYLL